MVRLAILLVGAPAVRRQWYLLYALGLAWLGLGLLVFFDASSAAVRLTTEVLGGLIALEGVVLFVGAWGSHPRSRARMLGRAIALVVLGLLIMDVPFDHGISDSVLFGLAFVADACLRMASAWVVRFRGWTLAMAGAGVELVLGLLVLADWPWSYADVIPYCMAIALVASGLTLMRLARQLRTLPEGASITELPMYQARPWHVRGRLVADDGNAFEVATGGNADAPMTLHVWTPEGSIDAPVPRPVVNRYIAAVDRSGVISTGHSSLELPPDLYISLYPAADIDHSPDEFTRLLRAGTDNDVPGRWNESLAVEVAHWRAPDRQVAFHRFNAASLRRFWSEFRQDTTYNLTSRSCSTSTSLALECALEGSLGSRRPWRAFFVLLFDPYLWLAAALRRRGVTMAWTPGLVLDYGRALKSVVERGRHAPGTTRPWSRWRSSWRLWRGMERG